MSKKIKDRMPDNVKFILEEINSNILRNYITNLQQENEYLKKQDDEKTKIGLADHKYASQMEEKVILLQQENERLKELCNKYEEEHNTIFKEWQQDIQANKKAIEYITSTTFFGLRSGKTFMSKYLTDLLNILQNRGDSQ